MKFRYLIIIEGEHVFGTNDSAVAYAECRTETVIDCQEGKEILAPPREEGGPEVTEELQDWEGGEVSVHGESNNSYSSGTTDPE